MSESNYAEEWLPAGEDLDITFRLPGPVSRRTSWGCPVCRSHVKGSTALEMTPCPQCGSLSLLAGSISGFSHAPQKVMIVSPPLTAPANAMPAFFHGVTSQLVPDSRLIIDLTQAGMTSEVIGSIVLLNRKAKHAQLWLPEFVVPDDHPSRYVFRLTRLDQVFNVHTTVDAALAALK